MAGVLAAVLVVVFGVLIFLNRSRHKDFDLPLQKALAAVPSISAYSQHDETQTQISDRRLQIVGVYDVDTAHRSFASYSTTTLFLPGSPAGHSFSHWDIAIGDDVYIKIDTTDKLLSNSIQRFPQWKHFVSNAIPAKYASIAIVGPIQDNLTLLAQNGAYLSLVKKWGPAPWGDESLLRYTFKLSGKTADIPGGPLSALVSHIGRTGTVDVWVDPKSFAVRHLVFSNPPYVSTSTISNINALQPIVAPITPGP